MWRVGRVGDIAVSLFETSGVDAPRNKSSFFSPPASGGFLGVRGCAREFPFFVSLSDWDVLLSLDYYLFRRIGILDTARTEAERLLEGQQ